jgi:osmotically-inducible protein OsmY
MERAESARSGFGANSMFAVNRFQAETIMKSHLNSHVKSSRFNRLTTVGLAGLMATTLLAHAATPPPDCPKSTATQDALTDTRLETAYLFNPHLNNFTIDTDVEDGTVMLSGSVRSEIDKDLAEEIAKSIDGVKSVKNSLEVKDGQESSTPPTAASDFFQKVSDATTTARIKTRLIANENLAAADIDVDTENNAVRLSGEVRSTTESQLAEFIARNTSGVESVANELDVRKPEPAAGA